VSVVEEEKKKKDSITVFVLLFDLNLCDLCEMKLKAGFCCE